MAGETEADQGDLRSAGSDGAERVFLGWDGPMLEAAAGELIDQYGSDLHGLVVGLPGKRAGRRLEELLAARGVIRPAEITTAGRLSDRLLLIEQTVAERSARTLTWAKVLRGATDLSPLLALRPAEDDVASWLALAAEVRGLHGELVVEGLGFDTVVACLKDSAGPASEISRWELLTSLQQAYRDELASHGLVDAHDARWQALRAGALDDGLQVVLVGVTDMSGLLRETLRACAGRVTAFVGAPPAEQESFDELGGLCTGAFLDRPLPLDLDHWWVESDPAAQAERVLSLIAENAGERSASEITVGLPDEQIEASLVSCLAAAGVPARGAQGAKLSQGAVSQLLGALAAYLRGRGVEAFAALLRHPDLEAFLASKDGPCPAEWFDEWSSEHLPRDVPKRWRPLSDDQRDAARAQGLSDLSKGLAEVLGDLDGGERRSLAAWAPHVREALGKVYGGWSLTTLDRPAMGDGQDAAQLAEARLVYESLKWAGRALADLEDLPKSLVEGWDVSAADAVRWVADALSTGFLPGAAGDESVELLGWLELPLDDAPLLIVTGFNDGLVPESINGHGYLPDTLRRRLGLPNNDDRLARDGAALTMMVHSRDTVHFVGGRRSLSGDPLLPSRLAFACDREQLPLRVEAAFPESDAEAPAPAAAMESAADTTPSVPPCPEVSRPLEAMSVTAFGSYLRSPYSFYLEKRQGLRRAEDGQREMDGLVFGNVTHAVLERFGRSDVRDSCRAVVIDKALQEFLSAVAEERFGRSPQPAVAVQLQQLGQRLQRFAQDQAAWAANGWRIEAVEWAPEGGAVPLLVDDEVIALRGRIDRIDRNENTGQLAILDYKTGETIDKPALTHGPDKNGCWKDLQLPLYVLLAESWDAVADTQLGYFALPQDSAKAGVLLADWRPVDLARAHYVAEEIVRRVRRNEVADLGRYPGDDPVWGAIAGIGLVGGPVPKRFVMTMPEPESEEGEVSQ
ncbi:MAG: ATP-dependent helicase/nuclease subunit B [Pseudohongiellaceae bacterium]|jgi:ATP-dependent helicase/nuclease subunit B